MTPARSGVFVRIAWGIVVGFILLHAASVLFYSHEKMVSEAGLFAMATAERTLTVRELLAADPGLRDVLSTPSFTLFEIGDPVEPPRRVWPHSGEVRASLVEHLRSLGFAEADQTRFWFSAAQGDLVLTLQLPHGGKWMLVEARSVGGRGHSVVVMFWTTLLTLLILGLVLWATRRFTRVLPSFVGAAERIGRDASQPALQVQGPREIRRLARAFNAMQSRVAGLLAERNTMLGALSHDVRTLVTRLTLRLDELPEEQRARARNDADAISRLLDEALAFSRDEAGSEARRAVDLPSLLQSVVDDEVDQGSDASYEGPEALTLTAEPTSLRRLFGNLVSNGLRYGRSVRVRLSPADDEVSVDIIDQGPGIPAPDRERVLDPFVRLEESRNRDTGGSGLGLTIVRNIVARHRGRLEFLDSPEGFIARVWLPVAG